MSAAVWLPKVRSQRVIAVIRAARFEVGIEMARAVAQGGLELIEVTWNSERPAQLIDQLRRNLPDCVIGAGTLLTRTDLETAIEAGAQYLFSPHTNLALIEAAVERQIPIVPGALSPTEIVTAWQAGATCVKVFPIDAVGGAAYIRHLQGPLAQIPLIPTGGVTLENAKTFIKAGAIAVGLSGQLFPKQAIEQGDWKAITERARGLVQGLRAIEG